LLEQHHSKGDQLFRVSVFFFEPAYVMRSRRREGEQRARREDVGSEFYLIAQVDEKPRVWIMRQVMTEVLELDA
jgi:hypothetical protein